MFEENTLLRAFCWIFTLNTGTEASLQV